MAARASNAFFLVEISKIFEETVLKLTFVIYIIFKLNCSFMSRHEISRTLMLVFKMQVVNESRIVQWQDIIYLYKSEIKHWTKHFLFVFYVPLNNPEYKNKFSVWNIGAIAIQLIALLEWLVTVYNQRSIEWLVTVYNQRSIVTVIFKT
jgi:hypothetical protein